MCVCHRAVECNNNPCTLNTKSKGKVRPTTGNEGPEEKQRYSSTLSLNLALDEAGG
jgi:hypothetical protein